jgi:hypothetical protein
MGKAAGQGRNRGSELVVVEEEEEEELDALTGRKGGEPWYMTTSVMSVECRGSSPSTSKGSCENPHPTQVPGEGAYMEAAVLLSPCTR